MHWPKIRDGGKSGAVASVTSDWSPQKIAEDFAAVVGVVLSIIPMIFSGGGSDRKSTPNYGSTASYPPGGLPRRTRR
jgi:hypothetical protein